MNKEEITALGKAALATAEYRQQQTRLMQLEQELVELERTTLAKSFEAFCKAAWPHYLPGRECKWNWHMSQIAHILQLVGDGEITGWVIVTIPPRMSKSSLVSVLFPAWVWTSRPHLQFMTLSHSERFSIRDAVATRSLLQSEWYQRRWGDLFSFSSDQNEKSRYTNSKKGHRVAYGLRQSITGSGGDVLLIDDPLDAKDVFSEARRQYILDAIDHAIPTRLNDMNTGVKFLIMQRIHEEDPVGHIKDMFGDEVIHLNIPMRYEGDEWTCEKLGLRDPRTEKGELLDPIRMNEKNTSHLEKALGEYASASQLQQRPAPLGGGIIKRKDWNAWVDAEGDPKELPLFDEIMIGIDGAYTTRDVGKDEKFDPKRSQSAIEVWGIFKERRGIAALMLIDSWMDWVDYTAFKRQTVRLIKQYKPDAVIIEKKASGISLIQDLRRARIPVIPYNPDRDKTARLYACQPAFEAGLINYYPSTTNSDVIHQFTNYPKAKLNDAVDAGTVVIQRFLRTCLLELPTNEQEDIPEDDWEDYNTNIIDAGGEEAFW